MATRYRLRARNFGPIRDAEVELRPLTVFVGTSNTGKSYLAGLLYALHRSLSDSMHVGPMGRRVFSHRLWRSRETTQELQQNRRGTLTSRSGFRRLPIGATGGSLKYRSVISPRYWLFKGVPMAERDRRLYRPVKFRGGRVMPLATRYGDPVAPYLPGGTVAEHSDELPEQLQRFVVNRSGADMVGIAEAASRLGVSRATIYDWATKNTLIAWRSGQRGLEIPATQIVDKKIVPGLAEVVDVVGSPQLAWAFLDQEWPFEDGVALPLERLYAGHLDEVLAAAAGFGATFT